VGIERKKVNWILDLDIRGFFDNLNHEQLVQYVEERIADPRMLRLIRKWLKAGVMEDGEWKATEVGTPQGSSISPLLANVYLHYALDLWVMAWRRQARGDVIMVRYADDAVLGFENRDEAESLRRELQEQLRKVGLELHPEKTRMIEFGRFAESNRKRRGEGKPETFDFLGFTHMCGRTRTARRFTVKRKTIGKRMRAKLQEIRQKLRQRMHDAVPKTGKWLRSVVCRATSTITRFPATGNGSRPFAMGLPGTGGRRYAAVANVAASTGSAWTDWCVGGFPASASCIRIRVSALTPFIQGRSRMRESRSYGSVRGVAGDRYPYRDSLNGFVVRRDKTGMMSRMKESARKGVVTHPDPESCTASREAGGEA
jgi:Reverse transcriptase (RNA-dependent DNA polymerase)